MFYGEEYFIELGFRIDSDVDSGKNNLFILTFCYDIYNINFTCDNFPQSEIFLLQVLMMNVN